MNSLYQILDKLQLTEYQGLFYFSDENSWKNRFPYWITRALEIIKPDAFYCYKNDNLSGGPFILFFDNPDQEKERHIHKQVWNFNQAPVVFIIKANSVEVYNGFAFEKNKSQLQLLTNKIKNWEEFSLLKLQSGVVWESYKNVFRSDKRVDYFLLENINAAIDKLSDLGLERTLANNLIGRLLFTRYLIDRNVNIDEKYIVSGNSENRKESFLELIIDKGKLYKYFEYLKNKFNGNLFPVNDSEYNSVLHKHLSVLHDLFNGVEIETGQLSLFDIYDFSIIPIELISNIYERFIGTEQQKKDKAFYTPSFLVDYILSQTIEPFLLNTTNISCKVLDPACGSGIFLVETLRKIIEKQQKYYSGLTDEQLRNIVLDNIFGIDKDENAINVAIFSLYITMLDYKEPKDIENFTFPVLKGTNFFTADIFDLKNDFNKVLKNIDFNFIIGNPPWGRNKNKFHIDYINNCDTPISNYQISQSFMVRVKDFSSIKTSCAFIVSSKILYNINAKEFRTKFLHDNYIDKVLELSIIRRKIFSKAIGPGVVLLYQYAHGKDTSKNILKHISLKPNLFFNIFKTITIEKYDHKEVVQSFLLTNDWLWKVLLYGNVLDYTLIIRLKAHDTLRNLLDHNKISYGGGFKAIKTIEKNNDKYFPQLKKYKLIEPRFLEKFYVNISDADFNTVDSFERINKNNLQIYNAPHILIKRTINDAPVVSYTDNDCVFSNLIHGISGNTNQSDLLKSVAAFLTSDIVKYLLFLLSSQWGIERDEIYIREILSLPLASNILSLKLSEDYDNICEEVLKNRDVENIMSTNHIDAKEDYITKMNKKLSNFYQLDDSDIDLINYTKNISIPIFKGKSMPYRHVNKQDLEKYADVFIKHFSNKFNKYNEYFKVQIYSHEYLIAMNFTITDEKPIDFIEFVCGEDINSVFKLMGIISWEKISTNLFIQKDVKGFDENSFYIVKPNEYKNWHKAVARLDIIEIMDAIMIAGKNEMDGFYNVER